MCCCASFGQQIYHKPLDVLAQPSIGFDIRQLHLILNLIMSLLATQSLGMDETFRYGSLESRQIRLLQVSQSDTAPHSLHLNLTKADLDQVPRVCSTVIHLGQIARNRPPPKTIVTDLKLVTRRIPMSRPTRSAVGMASSKSGKTYSIFYSGFVPVIKSAPSVSTPFAYMSIDAKRNTTGT